MVGPILNIIADDKCKHGPLGNASRAVRLILSIHVQITQNKQMTLPVSGNANLHFSLMCIISSEMF